MIGRVLFTAALLLPRLVFGQVYGGPLCGFTPSASRCVTGVGDVINVKDQGAVGDGVSDDTAAIQAALTAAGVSGSGVFLPAGKYLVTSSLLLTSPAPLDTNLLRGVSITGAGEGATVILTPTSGTGFPVFRNSSSKTCTGGAGSCDIRLNSTGSGRGAGCVCNVAGDCASGTCAGTVTSLHNMAFRDFGIEIRQDNMVGIDLSCMGETLMEHVHIAGKAGLTHTNTTGLIMSDDNGACSGYSNTILASRLNVLDVCARIRKSANDERFISNIISGGCGSGIALESGVQSNKIEFNLLQSTATAVCGAPCTAATCCGGYFHGKTCTVAADCGEADVVGMGLNDFIGFNHIEDSNNPHIRLGENSITCPTCGAFTAQETIIMSNLHAGSGTPIVPTTGKNQRPWIMETIFPQTIMVQLFSQPPPWTAYGFLESLGQEAWAWQVRDTTTTVDAIGMAAPVITGTQSNVIDGTGRYLQLISGAVAGNFAGLQPAGGTFSAFQFQEKPMFAASMRTGTSLASVRFWIGLFSGDPTASSTPALSYTAFRYDDSLDGTTWKFCTDSGTGTPNNAGACADTGITVSTSSRYDFMISTGTFNGTPAAAPTAYLNGAIVANSTTPLPASGTALHANMTVTTTNAAGKVLLFGRIAAASPGVNKASIP